MSVREVQEQAALVEKRCRVCGVSQPLDRFYRRRSSSDGYRNDCKDCFKQKCKRRYQEKREEILAQNREYYERNRAKVAETNRQWVEANKDKVRRYKAQWAKDRARERDRSGFSPPETKVCVVCSQEKGADEFYTHATSIDGLRGECKSCRRKYIEENAEMIARTKRSWRRANRDKIKRQGRLWREKNVAKYTERKREYGREYYKKNRDRLRARHREYIRNNPQVKLAGEARRRARKAAADGSCSTEQYQARWDYYGGKCVYCGEDAEHMDHFFPLASNGSNWPANLRPACAFCNISKGAKDPWEWLDEQK